MYIIKAYTKPTEILNFKKGNLKFSRQKRKIRSLE